MNLVRIKNLFLLICSLSYSKSKSNAVLKMNRLPTFHDQKNIEHFYKKNGKTYKIRGVINEYLYDKVIGIIRMTNNLTLIKDEICMFCMCDISQSDDKTVIITIFMPKTGVKVNVNIDPKDNNLINILSKAAMEGGMRDIDADKRKNMIIQTLIANNIRSIKSYNEIFIERDGEYEIDINIVHRGEVYDRITINPESGISIEALRKLGPFELQKGYIAKYLELYKQNYHNLSEFRNNVDQKLKKDGYYWSHVKVANAGFNPKTNSREIQFFIQEGPRCTVRKFNLEIDSRVPQLIKDEIKLLPIIKKLQQPHPFSVETANNIVNKVREYLKDRNLTYLHMKFKGDLMEYSKIKINQHQNPNSVDVDMNVTLEIFIDDLSQKVNIRTDVNEDEPIPIGIDTSDLRIGLDVQSGDFVSPNFIKILQEDFNQTISLNEKDLEVKYKGIAEYLQPTTKLRLLTLNPSIQMGNLFGTKSLFQAKVNAAKLIPPIARFIDQWTFMFPIVPLNLVQGVSEELFTSELIQHLSPSSQFITNVNYNKNLFVPSNIYLFRNYWIKSQHLLLPYGLFELFIRPMFFERRQEPSNLIKTDLIGQTLWDVKRDFLLHDCKMRLGRGLKLQYSKFDLLSTARSESAFKHMFFDPEKSISDINGTVYVNAIWRWPDLMAIFSNELLFSKMNNECSDIKPHRFSMFNTNMGWKVKGEIDYNKEFEDSVITKGNLNLRFGFMPITNLSPLYNFQFSDVSSDYFQIGPSIDSHHIPIGGKTFFHGHSEILLGKRILLGIGVSNLWNAGLGNNSKIKENADESCNLFFSIGLKMQKRSFRINIPLNTINRIINCCMTRKIGISKNIQMLDFTIKP